MSIANYIQNSITEQDTFNYTITDILRERARLTPDLIAYQFLKDGEDDVETVTYLELDQAANLIAQRLREFNVQGERALMLFHPGMEFIKSLYGCFYAGIVAIPAYPPRKNRSIDRIKSMVFDSGAVIVLSVNDIYQSSERSFSDIEDLKQMRWLLVDKLIDDKFHSDDAVFLPQPTDIALLQYTSGSTGEPKGVMVTHQNILRNAEFIRTSFNLTPKSISVTWLPSFHDMGLIDGVLDPVYNGYTGVIMPPVAFIQKPVRWLKAITKYKGTHGGAPNFAYDLCIHNVSEEEKQGIDLSTMNTMYCGAEPIRKKTFEQFIHTYTPYGLNPKALYPCYGMAETTLIISGVPAGRGPVYLNVSANALAKNEIVLVDEMNPDSYWLVGAGHPWLDTKVKIVDPESLLPCPDNQVGEIWVSGSIVTAGYWNKPKLTQETYAAHIEGEGPERYFRTGDLGFYHQGELYITGRLKDILIIHGRNYYPQDIEFFTETCHSAIRPAASAAFSVEVAGEEKLVIVAEVQRTAIRELDVEAVSNAIRQVVAEEMEQEVYAIQLLRTASILKTSSGKIQHKACREGFLNKTLDVVGESVINSLKTAQALKAENGRTAIDPASIQTWLMAWICIKMGVSIERIDVSKIISHYGLDSMKAIQLQQDILLKYAVDVPPYLLFEKITIHDLSEKILALMQEKQLSGV